MAEMTSKAVLALKLTKTAVNRPMSKKIYKIPTYRLQLVRDGSVEAHTITIARDVFKAIKSFKRSDREQFVALYLNARNRVIAHHIVSVGTANTCLVHPREVFKPAILKNACGLIIAHNHPSGGSEPSEADLELTKRLKDAGTLLGIELLDHVIITPQGETLSII
jgi:DNA repair protein RadC